MRVLHLHERAGLRGGVEQITHDLAAGLSARGWPQALLCRAHAGDAKFDAAFARVCTDHTAAAQFRPDVVVLHKWSDARLVESLLACHPTLQVVHDHDLYCPRKHKYFPLSHRACGEKAGGACIRHLCLLERRDGLTIYLITVGDFTLKAQISQAMITGLIAQKQRFLSCELPANGICV